MPITVNTGQLGRLFSGITGGRQAVLSALVKPVNDALKQAEREIVQLTSGPVLRVRSGQARASVRIVPAQLQGDTIDGGVGSNSPYLHFLYKGGTIRPRNAKMLAIPVGPALTPAGVARYSSPRDVAGLFVVKSKAGNLLLAKRNAGKEGIIPFFVLKRQVTIGAHDFLSQPKQHLTATLQRTLPAAIAQQVSRHA